MDQGQLSLAGPLDGISRLSNSNTHLPGQTAGTTVVSSSRNGYADLPCP